MTKKEKSKKEKKEEKKKVDEDKPFDFKCPKCGYFDINMRHITIDDDDEKLACTCMRCSYHWDEATMDKR